mmetsp:Transcript_27614/g.49243  ORF Transcript_27614/g.49243 Transcript_27614/m.49243 type:complete len:178 (-) Transcript_27614:104-637(-)
MSFHTLSRIWKGRAWPSWKKMMTTEHGEVENANNCFSCICSVLFHYDNKSLFFECVGFLAGDEYLEYINLLNQLMMMATQLHNDALDPRNHKYSAHQIAILYQSLNMLKGQTKPLRKRIEERFDEIKTITESVVSPYLGSDLQFWLQQITWDCRCMIVDLPPFIHQKLRCISDVIHI